MMIIFSFIFFFNKFNKYLMQLFIQNMFFMYILFILINYPLNSLSMFSWIYLSFGMDLYSWGLIILSIWILNMMILVSSNIFIYSNNYIYYMILLKLILLFLMLSFYTLSLLWFYFFFESSMIPMFLLIMGWGYQINRIQASMYMLLYTVFGSLPLLLMIIYWFQDNYSLLMSMNYMSNYSVFFYFFMILGFLIKMPMYLMHLWLPKAHVEAPIMGSMILAGVMLKLGSYGLMRVLLMMSMNYNFNKYFMIMSIIGGIYSSLICLNQVDMKILVAYSSIVHMSLLMMGLFSLFNKGYLGAYLMMISHGLCSSGLFYLVNINYERFKSRSIYINKGLINLFPSLSLMWFLMISSNLSFPPSLNLFSEILLIMTFMEWMSIIMIILFMYMIFSAIYSLYMYSFSQQGKFLQMKYLMNIKLIEYYILFMHWIPLNLMFFISYMFI
uniref:NADH-ubiquinone oxidoreductase chain 4 n=1 Tax=Ichneumonidae sp. MT-2014 TaxID=1560014 RepID=A0A0A0RVW8_9HYME|nr:NADH dehydrogenase subunit 4 [Ichneumonidae sp. MT-2014]